MSSDQFYRATPFKLRFFFSPHAAYVQAEMISQPCTQRPLTSPHSWRPALKVNENKVRLDKALSECRYSSTPSSTFQPSVEWFSSKKNVAVIEYLNIRSLKTQPRCACWLDWFDEFYVRDLQCCSYSIYYVRFEHATTPSNWRVEIGLSHKYWNLSAHMCNCPGRSLTYILYANLLTTTLEERTPNCQLMDVASTKSVTVAW